MAEFKWDDFEEVTPSDSPAPFNWEAFEEVRPDRTLTDHAKEFGQATIENLPAIGAMGGAMLTAPGGPLLGMGGAALGGYAGKSVQNLINTYANPELAPQKDSQYLTQPLQAGVMSAAGEAGGQVLGKFLPKAVEGAKWLGRKALTTLGPTEEAIKARLAGRAKPTAPNYPELAEKMGADLSLLQKQISEGHKIAEKTLTTGKKLSTAKITQPIYKEIHDLKIDQKTFGPEDKKILNFLDELSEDAKKFGSHVSEQQVFRIIRKLDDNINWNDQTKNVLNNKLKSIRQAIDLDLKLGNIAYRDAMKPVHQRMKVLEAIQKRFTFKQVPGEGLQATDTSANNIQNSLRENKNVTRRGLGTFKKFIGNDYQELAKDYQNAKQFIPSGGERSSARTNLGTALGTGAGYLLDGTVGGVAGGMAGSFTGKLADRYGGQWAGKIIDIYNAAGNSAVFGKFAPLIEKAMKQGPASLSTLGAMLSQNPEFKQILMGL